MSFLRTIFHRGPTIQQQHIDHWLQDRQGAMQEYYQKRRDGMDFDQSLKEYGPMLRRESLVREWEKGEEIERVRLLRAQLPKSSRFTRLRMKRGLPFKSRRQS